MRVRRSLPRPVRLSGSPLAGELAGSGSVVVAAALWGTTGTAAAFAPSAASPISVGAARIVFGGLLLLVLAIRGGGLVRLIRRNRTTRIQVALGVIGIAAYQICFFSAVATTGVAIGTMVTIGSAPVLTGLLARLQGQHALSLRWAIATAAAIAGCVTLITGGRTSAADLFGVCLAVLAGASYACYAVIASRLITAGAHEQMVMGALFGGGGLLLVPVLLASSPEWLLEPRGIAVAAYLAVFATTVGYLLYGKGLRSTPVAIAATLTLAEPAVAALLGVLVLGEQLTGSAVSGLALIGLALLVLMIPIRQLSGKR